MRQTNLHHGQRVQRELKIASASGLFGRNRAAALIGLAVFVPAITLVFVSLLVGRPVINSAADGGLLIFLVSAVASSRLWPIRVGRATALYVATVPLYLLACLFSPPIAAASVGVGMLARETSACRVCANSAGSVLTQVGRWILLTFLASAAVHAWSTSYLGYSILLAVAILWIGDILTSPLILSPVIGTPPFQTIVTVARQTYSGELIQYLIAMMTVLLFRTGILWTGIIWVDVLAAMMLVSPLLLLYLYLQGEDSAPQVPSTPAGSRALEQAH